MLSTTNIGTQSLSIAIDTIKAKKTIFTYQMNAQLIPYRKARLAKWLFSITLVISLFALSVPATITNRLPQKTNSELIYSNKQRSPAKSVPFWVNLRNSVTEVQAAQNTLCLLVANHSIAIQFNHLAVQYAKHRQRIISPAITCIFNHSGQIHS